MSNCSTFNLRTLHANRSGFTLIELLVAMAISTIVTGAAISLYRTSIGQNQSIVYSTQLQEESFFISHVLKQQMAQIGYRPINRSKIDGRTMPIDDREIAFPEVPNVWDAGQIIKITNSIFSYRFHGASTDDLTHDFSIFDCLGNPVAQGDLQVNQISIQDNQLICITDDSVSVILGASDGVTVENVAYEIGVDDDADFVVDRSIDASGATNSDFLNTKQLNIRLLLATPDGVASDKQSYYFNGEEFMSTDRRVRLESEISLALRN